MLPFARRAAPWVIAVLTVIATADSFAQSFHGLLAWAFSHRDGAWAWGFPVMIDTFVVVGEVRLFIAAVDGAATAVKARCWLVTAAGLAASIGGNVGHVGFTAPLGDQVTAAVPPLAATVSLGVLLGLVKATSGAKSTTAARKPRSRDDARETTVVKPAGAAPAPSETSAAPAGKRTRGRRTKPADPGTVRAVAERLAAGEALSRRGLAAELDLTPYRAETILTAARANGHLNEEDH
jgi:hypothetical protein